MSNQLWSALCSPLGEFARFAVVDLTVYYDATLSLDSDDILLQPARVLNLLVQIAKGGEYISKEVSNNENSNISSKIHPRVFFTDGGKQPLGIPVLGLSKITKKERKEVFTLLRETNVADTCCLDAAKTDPEMNKGCKADISGLTSYHHQRRAQIADVGKPHSDFEMASNTLPPYAAVMTLWWYIFVYKGTLEDEKSKREKENYFKTNPELDENDWSYYANHQERNSAVRLDRCDYGYTHEISLRMGNVGRLQQAHFQMGGYSCRFPTNKKVEIGFHERDCMMWPFELQTSHLPERFLSKCDFRRTGAPAILHKAEFELSLQLKFTWLYDKMCKGDCRLPNEIDIDYGNSSMTGD